MGLDSNGFWPVSQARRRIRQALKECLVRTVPRRWLVTSGPADTRSVYLTFDDGPHIEHTPKLLDMLQAQRVPATFFVIGKFAERHPEIVRRAAREGHTIGNHSYYHAKPETTSVEQLADEVECTRALLRPLIGCSSDLFRPPQGAVTAAKLRRLWRSNQSVVLWNVDPRDYAQPSAADLAAWFHANPLRGGDIVLLHDAAPHAVRVLPELIAAARRRGLSFRPLDGRVFEPRPVYDGETESVPQGALTGADFVAP